MQKLLTASLSLVIIILSLVIIILPLLVEGTKSAIRPLQFIVESSPGFVNKFLLVGTIVFLNYFFPQIYLSYLKYYVNLRWLHHFNTHMSYMYHNYVSEIANVRASFRVEVTTKINLFQQLADERSEQRLVLKELAEAGDAKAIAKREIQREQTRERVKRYRANHHV